MFEISNNPTGDDMAHRRRRLGLTVGVLLAGTLATGPGAAAEGTDYTIDVDTSRTGA